MKTKKILSIILIGTLTLPLSVFGLDKTESVFSTHNTDGTLENITVTNHIRVKTKEELLDQSDLDNIKNLNGNETFIQNEKNITWKAKGKDIYYQGTIAKEMPLDIGIKYYLDDKEINIKDLIGKKGNVKIQLNFTNKEKNTVNINGKNETIYTPFVVMAGTILDSKNNSNINIKNGKVVETGTKNIVAGIASPGLFESLNMDNKMDKIEISYTTSHFTLNNIYIIATPKVIEESDIKGFEKIELLAENINRLQSNMDAIENGSLKLKNGIEELDNGVGSLKNGMDQLHNGVNKINESMPNENDNIKNEQTLNYLKNQNTTTINKISEANKQLLIQKEEVENKITEVKAKKEYVNSKIEQVKSNLTKATQVYNDYNVKLEQVNSGIVEINSKISLCDEETKKILENKLNELTTQKQNLEIVVPLLKNQMDAVNGTLEALDGTLNSLEGTLSLLEQTKTSLDINIESNNNLSKLVYGNNQVVDSSINTIGSMRKLTSAMNELSVASNKIKIGTSDIKNGTEKLSAGSNELTEGISKFNKEGINKLSIYSGKINYYKNKLEALIDLSRNYKGFSSDNASETIFISKIKSAK